MDCISLAMKGNGYVSPNPMVVCVIFKNNRIIGNGYHKGYGKPHAEVNAINCAIKNGHNLRGSTMYVNLEPCTHFGKTPPCTDEIIKHRIKKVYIGIKDPNKSVNGKGIKKLRDAGIDVQYNILKNECKELNKIFIKNVTYKLPYITLKIAQSIDGKIALKNFQSKYITSDKSRKFVYNLRSGYDAVLIGTKTAYYDNPDLTTHSKNKNEPIRIVIDRDFKLQSNLKMFSDDYSNKTIRIISESKYNNIFDNIIHLKTVEESFQIIDILKELYNRGIMSLLVEGGANIFSQFIITGLFDDIYFIVAPKILGEGLSSFDYLSNNKIADANNLKLISIKQLKHDLIIYYKKENVHRNSNR